MPLLVIPKKKKEEEWKFNHTELDARKSLPDEQIKSANHDSILVNQMIACEKRDPEIELVRREVLIALSKDNINPIKALAATAHMTVEQRNTLMKRITQDFLRITTAELDLKDETTTLILKTLSEEDKDRPDMFDFIIRLEERLKKKK